MSSMKKFDPANRRSYNLNNQNRKDYKPRRFKKRDGNNTLQGTVVYLREGETADNLIKRFKKIVELAGIMRELKKREYYLSPAQKKKDKRKKAAKRARKEAKRGKGNFSDRE